MEMILSYLAIACPGLVSIIATVFVAASMIGKLTTFIAQFTSDKNAIMAQLAASDTENKTKIMELIEQNRELTKANKLLTDHITRIQGYSDSMMNKGGE